MRDVSTLFQPGRQMGQLAGEGELAQVGHAHRVEDAVEMIHLVLQDAREQPVASPR